MKPRAALLLLLVSALLAPGCITDPVTGRSVLGIPTSDAEEIQMGARYAPSFKSQYEGAYPDAELNAYLGEIVLGMAKNSHRPNLPWTFTLLNSSEVNAFALPGGTVCITRGLLYQIDTEAEFAAVMGHEVGHVNHRHSVQQQGQAALVGLLVAGVSLGVGYVAPEYAEAGQALGAMGGQLVLLGYSRGDEMEADQRGVEYSYRAGYDPRELAGVFELFKKMKGDEAPPELLSTHPLDDKRIAAVTEEIELEYPEIIRTNGAGLTKTTAKWDRLMGRLRAAQKVYDRYDAASAEFGKALQSGNTAGLRSVLATVEECERALPDHGLLVSAVGVVNDKLGNTRVAKRKFEQAASMQSDLFEPRLYLARMALTSGDAAGAHRWAEQAVALYPHHYGAQFIDGRALDSLGRANEAVERYSAVVQLAPEQSSERQFCVARIAELNGTATR